MTMTPLDFHMMARLSFEGQSIFVNKRRVVTLAGVKVWFLAHFDGPHMLQPLKYLAISWSLQNLYQTPNRKKGHLITYEQVRTALDRLTEEQVSWFSFPYTEWISDFTRQISQHYVVFYKKYEYHLYLAERVIRQHSLDFPLRAPFDPSPFMRRPQRMEAETINLL
ncbi:hypothetical protein LguiA_023571 [Lonicera macranthoides]